MKNADMPANAQSFAMTENECGTPFDFMNETKKYTGLTKREMIAMHAMQGILSNSETMNWIAGDDGLTVSSQAVIMADALLEELAK